MVPLVTCFGPTAAHDGLDVAVTTIVRPDGPDYDRALCRGCRGRLAEMGFDMHPGREAAMPVFRERRRFGRRAAA